MQFCQVCESVHSHVINLCCSHKVCLICAARNVVNHNSNINDKYICSVCFQPTRLTQRTRQSVINYIDKYYPNKKSIKKFHIVKDYKNCSPQLNKKDQRKSIQKQIEFDYYPKLVVESPKLLKNKLKHKKKTIKNIKSAKEIKIQEIHDYFVPQQSIKESLSANKISSANSINQNKASCSMQRLLFSNNSSFHNSSTPRKSQQKTVNIQKICNQHSNKVCQYFCFDCDQYICSQCSNNRKHNEHNKLLCEQVKSNLKEQINNLFLMLQKRQKQNQQVRKQVDSFFGEIQKIQAIQIEKIQAQFQDLFNNLKNKQKELLWQIKVRQSKLLMLYQAQSSKIQKQHLQIASSMQFIQRMQLQLQQSYYNIQQKKKQLTRFSNKLEGRKHSLKKIEFSPFEQNWYKDLDVVYAYPTKKVVENITILIKTLQIHFQKVANSEGPKKNEKLKQITSIEDMLKKQDSHKLNKSQSKQLDIQNFPDIISYTLSKTNSINQSSNDYLLDNDNISSIFKPTSKY